MNRHLNSRRSFLVAGLGLGMGAVLPTASAAEASSAAVHRHSSTKGLKVAMQNYVVPQLSLVRDDGKVVSLPKELDDGRMVVLNFIYTTCPGICPVMSHVFSQFQERLGSGREKVHMVSISIDPEQDTPARLRAYATQFSAGRQWQHYTGTVDASVRAQKAFDAYRGDKMSHDPLTLMRAAPGKPWIRVDGFASADDLLEQYVTMAEMCETTTAAK